MLPVAIADIWQFEGVDSKGKCFWYFLVADILNRTDRYVDCRAFNLDDGSLRLISVDFTNGCWKQVA